MFYSMLSVFNDESNENLRIAAVETFHFDIQILFLTTLYRDNVIFRCSKNSGSNEEDSTILIFN